MLGKPRITSFWSANCLHASSNKLALTKLRLKVPVNNNSVLLGHLPEKRGFPEVWDRIKCPNPPPNLTQV